MTIENNVILGNCTNWIANPAVFGEQVATGRSGSNCNHNSVCDANENFEHCSDCVLFNYCRPAGHASISLVPGPGSNHRIIGNTISGNDDVNISETSNSSCTGAEIVYARNNVILGATEYNGGEADTSDFYYADCAGGGTPPVINEDYDFICASKTYTTDCTGAHSHCYSSCSSLNLVGPLDDFTPGYYSGSNYIAAHYLTATSPAHGVNSADETVTLAGTSDDATNFKRRLVWDAGGLEYRPAFDLSTDQWNVSQ